MNTIKSTIKILNNETSNIKNIAELDALKLSLEQKYNGSISFAIVTTVVPILTKKA
ncbi:MAG: hypothetical protein RSA66_09340 [Muribaculaceae bacterium]